MQTEAWRALDHETENDLWDRFDKQFAFPQRPSNVTPGDWYGIVAPSPSVTYSLTAAFPATRDTHLRDEIIRDINDKALAAFRCCVAPEQKIYALDWQHPCYEFWPHAAFDADRPEAWRIPVLPDGDYYVFLAEDFSFGAFGHPWQETMCVFGQPLVEAFERDPPTTFEVIRRK